MHFSKREQIRKAVVSIIEEGCSAIAGNETLEVLSI
jgi:hypothetical protein